LGPEITEKDFYENVLQTLKDEFLTDPVTLGSFELGLSLHTAAPKIEAYYQYYRSSVVPSLGENYDEGCEAWVHFDGQQFCRLEDFESALAQSNKMLGYVEHGDRINVAGKSRYCPSIKSTTHRQLHPRLSYMRTSKQRHSNLSTQP
jgi:hypothetical protein